MKRPQEQLSLALIFTRQVKTVQEFEACCRTDVYHIFWPALTTGMVTPKVLLLTKVYGIRKRDYQELCLGVLFLPFPKKHCPPWLESTFHATENGHNWLSTWQQMDRIDFLCDGKWTETTFHATENEQNWLSIRRKIDRNDFPCHGKLTESTSIQRQH